MFEIRQANAQITLQDLGSPNYVGSVVESAVDSKTHHFKAFYGGAVDRQALRLANRLLHNPDNSLALEFTGDIQILFQQTTWIALCGAQFEAQIETRQLWNGWRTKVHKGEIVTIRGPQTGVYGYLAIQGGISHGHINEVNNKYLHVGDQLKQNLADKLFSKPVGVSQRANDGILRVLPGVDLDFFTPPSRKQFWSHNWKLARQSDRIAAQLAGEPLIVESKKAFRPKNIMPGMVQILPDGQPFISLAETKTTAKNPVIAWVIEADLWKVAQTRAGERFSFQHVSPNQIESANYEWQQYFERLTRMLERNK